MNLLIKNAAQLITCSGFKAKQGAEMSRLEIIPDGALVIEDGLIRRTGKTEEVLTDLDLSSFEVLDAAGKAVLPGFIDPHTHFIFGGFRAEEFFWRLRGESYLKILEQGGGINHTVRATRQATREELLKNGLKRLDTFLSFGVTTVEGKSGYGLDHDGEIKQLQIMQELDGLHPVDVVRTFLGAHTVPPEFKGDPDGYITFLINHVLPEVASLELAEFCDVFCEKGVFSVEQSRRLLESAKARGLKIKLHADEMTSLGGAELAAELNALSADHLLYASDRGIAAMAEAGVVATLLPGTAFSLKEPYARARTMIDQGCAVALATDFNPGSCFSESLPLIMALAALYMQMTPEEIVTALTINAAAAIGRAGTIGSLDVGKGGDAVVLEFPSYLYLPYHLGVNSVEKVIKKGRIVFDKTKEIR